jgi:hypothetical protein
MNGSAAVGFNEIPCSGPDTQSGWPVLWPEQYHWNQSIKTEAWLVVAGSLAGCPALASGDQGSAAILATGRNFTPAPTVVPHELPLGSSIVRERAQDTKAPLERTIHRSRLAALQSNGQFFAETMNPDIDRRVLARS